MMNNPCLDKEAKAWVKRKSGPDEIVRVVPVDQPHGFHQLVEFCR